MAGEVSVHFSAEGSMSLLECPTYYLNCVPRIGEVVFTEELIKLGDKLGFEENDDKWTVKSVWWDFADDAETDATVWVTHPQYEKAIEAVNQVFEERLEQYMKGGSDGT